MAYKTCGWPVDLSVSALKTACCKRMASPVVIADLMSVPLKNRIADKYRRRAGIPPDQVDTHVDSMLSILADSGMLSRTGVAVFSGLADKVFLRARQRMQDRLAAHGVTSLHLPFFTARNWVRIKPALEGSDLSSLRAAMTTFLALPVAPDAERRAFPS